MNKQCGACNVVFNAVFFLLLSSYHVSLFKPGRNFYPWNMILPPEMVHSTLVRDTTFSRASPPKITKPKVLPDGTVGYYECKGGYQDWECKEFKIVKQGKLKPDSTLKQLIATTEGYPAWGEIWLESVDRTVKKKITPGKKYLFPKLSLDGSKIIASYGPAEFVLNLNGNVILDLGKERPQAPSGYLAYIGGASWSPDGKMIACQTYNANKIYVFTLK